MANEEAKSIETTGATDPGSKTTDWDVYGLYEGFRTTFAVDNSVAKSQPDNPYRLTDLQITGTGEERTRKIGDTANEIIRTNLADQQPASNLSLSERTALDLQRFIRQQLGQGTSPAELERSLKDLQCGWQVSLRDGAFNITRPNDPGSRIAARINVADVPTNGQETPQQAAARLAERLDVLQNNPRMLRAYMEGVGQFIARAQALPGGQDFANQFAEGFRARLGSGFQFELNGAQIHLARGTDREPLFRGTVPDAHTIQRPQEQFRLAQTTFDRGITVPPGTGERILQSLQDPTSAERQTIDDRIRTALVNPSPDFNVNLRRLHGLADNAPQSDLVNAIEANVRQNMRLALTDMRTFVNDHARRNNGTELSENASPQQIISELQRIRGEWNTGPLNIPPFDLSRHAFFYSFPRTAGAPDLPDGRTNPDAYYCHNFTLGQYGNSPNVIDELTSRGYQPVERGNVQVGDLVFYSQQSFDLRRDLLEPGHSARVVSVNPDGTIVVASKLNYGPLAMHHILDPSLLRVYGPHVSVYRRPR